MKRGGKDRSRSKGKGMAGSREERHPSQCPRRRKVQWDAEDAIQSQMLAAFGSQGRKPLQTARAEKRGTYLERPWRKTVSTSRLAAEDAWLSRRRRWRPRSPGGSSAARGGKTSRRPIPAARRPADARESQAWRPAGGQRRHIAGEEERPNGGSAAARPQLSRRDAKEAAPDSFTPHAPPRRGQEAALLQPRDTEGGGRGKTGLPPGGIVLSTLTCASLCLGRCPSPGGHLVPSRWFPSQHPVQGSKRRQILEVVVSGKLHLDLGSDLRQNISWRISCCPEMIPGCPSLAKMHTCLKRVRLEAYQTSSIEHILASYHFNLEFPWNHNQIIDYVCPYGFYPSYWS